MVDIERWNSLRSLLHPLLHQHTSTILHIHAILYVIETEELFKPDFLSFQDFIATIVIPPMEKPTHSTVQRALAGLKVSITVLI